MMVAAGPFTTSDNLDMTPLHDLLKKVSMERPTVLLLVGVTTDYVCYNCYYSYYSIFR